jgi:hypothetical protein
MGLCSSVNGGACNTVVGNFSSIYGGCFNKICDASSQYSTIISGADNFISGSTLGSILGGFQQVMKNSNCSLLFHSSQSNITRGRSNMIIKSDNSTIEGSNTFGVGENNLLMNSQSGFIKSNRSTILGGTNNTINQNDTCLSVACNSILLGGFNNITGNTQNSLILNSSLSTIGPSAPSTSENLMILGSRNSFVRGICFNAIIGGCNNRMCNPNSTYATIINGFNNVSCNNWSYTLGSNITTNRECTVFVNNLSIMNIPTISPSVQGAVWRCPGEDILRIVV